MNQQGRPGLPLLRAAADLLDDAPTHIFTVHFRSLLNDPRKATEIAHYQGVIWRALRESLQDGRLMAIGFPDKAEAPKAIHPQFFDAAEPDFVRSSLTSHGLTYSAVRVFEAGATSPGSVMSESPEGLTKAKGPSGRTPTHDWTAFAREVVRIGWQHGFTTRRALNKQMRDWCASNFPNPPDESQIRKEVLKLCPNDVPEQ